MNNWYMKYAVVVLSAMAGFAAHQWVPWCKLGAAEWASWVQAIGSIFAVGAAAWVAIYQNRTADRQAGLDRLLNRVEKLNAVHAIAVAGLKLLRDMEDAYLERRAVRYFIGDFSEAAFSHAHSAIKAIPLHELGSYNMVAGLMDLADALAQVLEAVNERRKHPGTLTSIETYELYILPMVEKARDGYRDIQSETLGAQTVYANAVRGSWINHKT